MQGGVQYSCRCRYHWSYILYCTGTFLIATGLGRMRSVPMPMTPIALTLAASLPQFVAAYLPAARPHARVRTRVGPVAAFDVEPITSGPKAASADAWLNQWYPVMFDAGVPDAKPIAATIFERPLVLFRDHNSSSVQCLADQCPHRLAPLSDGRLVVDEEMGTTRVECSYHGWQFAGCGACTKLPQIESGKPILSLYDARAYPCSVSQGIVYVFIGDAALAESVEVPRVPELDREGWIYEQDYMRDLPYDYTTLVENIIDPSHVPVSHHGTVQGDRSLAQPLTTKVRLRAAAPVAALPACKRSPRRSTSLAKVRISAEAADGTKPLGFAGMTEVPLHASTRLSFAQQKAEQRVEFSAP